MTDGEKKDRRDGEGAVGGRGRERLEVQNPKREIRRDKKQPRQSGGTGIGEVAGGVGVFGAEGWANRVHRAYRTREHL